MSKRIICIICLFFRNVSGQYNNSNNINNNNTNNANNANSKAATTTATAGRAKEILGEAADAVANSFAKNSNQQPGMNKGREGRQRKGLENRGWNGRKSHGSWLVSPSKRASL